MTIYVNIDDNYEDTSDYIASDSSEEEDNNNNDDVEQSYEPTYCVCCNDLITPTDFFLHIQETDQFLCGNCIETEGGDVNTYDDEATNDVEQQ